MEMIPGGIDFGTQGAETDAPDEYDATDSRLARIIN